MKKTMERSSELAHRKKQKLLLIPRLLIWIAGALYCGLTLNQFSGTKRGTVQTICGVVFCLFVVIGFIRLKGVNLSIKRCKKLTCDGCGAALRNDGNTEWTELKREWRESGDNKNPGRKLFVTVSVSCRCPECGKVKTFTECLCAGSIRSSGVSINDSVQSTEQVVTDYFNGFIRM